MSRRLQPTLADYLVIAVSPVLIMALVGSLVFFLLDIFYQGQYVGRLHYVFALFVMAAVLLGRIAIEMGSGHAMAYAAPLAIVTLLALSSFVQYPAGMAGYSLLANAGLVGLIMWCAQKLTWDCTFIDESQEESGEGVLRTMGLDRGGKRRQEPSSAPKPSKPKDNPPKKTPGTVSQEKPRPHSGGVWVVYFSLAALPLFGLLQRVIPAESVDRRRYAFSLLCVYVASALGLLLTTSFLGLRRYLRGKRLQMPVTMAGSWVMIGCILIAAILGFALLLPRPNPEYAISEVPWKLSSENRAASRYAVGREGTRDSRKDAPVGEDHTPAGAKKSRRTADGSKSAQQQGHAQSGKTPSQAGRPGGDRGPQKGSDAKSPNGAGGQRQSNGRDASPSGQSREGKSAGSRSGSGNAKGGSQQQGKEGSGDQKGSHEQGKSGDSEEQKGSQGEAKDRSTGDEKDAQDKSKGGPTWGRRTSSDRRADSRRGGRSQSGSQAGRSQPQPPPPAPKPSSLLPSWNLPLGEFLKWLLYLALVVAVAYGAWKSRSAIAEALRDFWEFLRTFWEGLFGSKRRPAKIVAAETASEKKPLPRPFAEYADPFAAGWAEKWPPEELIRYTFAALEAWAREHGRPRTPDQTAFEFAEDIGGRSRPLGRHCRKLADLYCRAAYAPGTLPAESVAPLREFWERLQASA